MWEMLRSWRRFGRGGGDGTGLWRSGGRGIEVMRVSLYSKERFCVSKPLERNNLGVAVVVLLAMWNPFRALSPRSRLRRQCCDIELSIFNFGHNIYDSSYTP
jgi:hypothetical protein